MTYTSSWRSPSNIALIKYWGKHGIQLPRNPSLSFTLSACHTNMQVRVSADVASPGLEVYYDGEARPAFIPKISSFFNLVKNQLPWLENASIVIDSVNTFPHGAGIASSASSMSALALCLADIDDQILSRSELKSEWWWSKASELARQGSGSACRSVFPGAALWGKTNGIPESNDSFAIPWNNNLAPIYQNYQDTILVVSSAEKKVSSSAGHELMSELAYADKRYAVAKNNMARLIKAMHSENDIDKFISICESEALQLHALMMSGDQPFVLMEPGTLSIIKEVWRFREETGVPVCFTLDAGPNVHLLYPLSYKKIILDWVITNLAPFCTEKKIIEDYVGSGPEKLF